jgi:arylsulfate sulfotransferase
MARLSDTGLALWLATWVALLIGMSRFIVTPKSLINVLLLVAASCAADTVTFTGISPGVTPFIASAKLTVTPANSLTSIHFTVRSKPGSVVRPISTTYFSSYLVKRGYYNSQTGSVTVPVFGLYSAYGNTVDLVVRFSDGTSQPLQLMVPTPAYNNSSGLANPIVIQARSSSTSLSYDYIMVKGRESDQSPVIVDTDGAVRWVGTSNYLASTSLFFNKGIYLAPHGPAILERIELDGTAKPVSSTDYAESAGITGFNHNIDKGRDGIIIDAGTSTYLLYVALEVDPLTGKVLHIWNFANILSQAMRAGGDDPTQFIYLNNGDAFHINSATYRPADNTLIVSSRENFVIAVDYDTQTIKWIFGDQTKKWYQFPSLRKYAVNAGSAGTIAPAGQHSVSIAADGNLLLFDNGTASVFQSPVGVSRTYSAPRKYSVANNLATEIWSYPRHASVKCTFCGSFYEDAPLNYLGDNAMRSYNGQDVAELYGLDSSGQIVFDYAYPNKFSSCFVAWNSQPIHLENLTF